MKNFMNFSTVKVLIVGDIMIDRYWWGSVDRISPEAPVPVVRLNNMTLTAGGAANVAANVAGLGAKPILIGVVGDDEEAKLFPKLLESLNIDPEYLVKVKNRQTTVKTRIIAHNQQVTRVDQETNLSLTEEQEEQLWKVIEKKIDAADIIILSDYAKGMLTDSLLAGLIVQAKKKNKFILIDPKGKNYQKYQGADIITPNQREIEQLTGLEINDQKTLEKIGENLIAGLPLRSLLVTQGEDGMTLFEKDKKTLRLRATARQVYDVTGAGDTVIAVMAVALGVKMSLEKSARLANAAAGLVVEQVGTTTIKLNDLQAVKDFT